MSAFNDTPDDVIERILGQLCAKDILSAAATCRRFKSLVDTSSILQLILELAVEGLLLSDSWDPYDPLQTPDQIRFDFHLREQRKRRLNYTYRFTTRLPTSRWRDTKSQFIHGILGYLFPVTGSRNELWFWDLRHSTLSRSATHARTPLQDKLPHPTIRHWVEFPLRLFTWDVTQDLLVLIEKAEGRLGDNIYLRSLSFNLPHPLATPPVIQSQECFSSAQIHESYLIVSGVRVYNWMNGELLYSIDEVVSFQLLNHEFMAVVSSDEGKPPLMSRRFHLRVHTIADGALCCILKLPTLPSAAIQFVHDSYRSNPEMLEEEYHEDSPDSYIYHPGNDRIFVLRVSENRVFNSRIHIVVSIQHVLATFSSTRPDLDMDTDMASPSSPSSIVSLEWQQWGPPATRWFLGSFEIISVFGPQFWIMTQVEKGGAHRKVAQLFDFSQRYHRRRQFSKQHAKYRLSLNKCIEEELDEALSVNQNGKDDRTDVEDGEEIVVEGGEADDQPLYLVGSEAGQQVVTREGVLTINTRRIPIRVQPPAKVATIAITLGPSTAGYLTPSLQSQLPFRVFKKACPVEPDQFRADSVHLGRDGVVGEVVNGVVHAFLF